MLAVCHPKSLAAVVIYCIFSSKSPSRVKSAGIKHDGKAAKTAPAAAVDAFVAAGEKGVRDTEPPLPDPDRGPPPPSISGDPVIDSGVDNDILSTKRS